MEGLTQELTLSLVQLACPPPTTATAGRGELSQGRVFDLYLLHLADTADTYLGRILVGLDPKNKNFATLPPYFIPTNPMADELIWEAMKIMFGPILASWEGKVSVTLQGSFAAAAICHSSLRISG